MQFIEFDFLPDGLQIRGIRTKFEENFFLEFDPHYLVRRWKLFVEIRTKLDKLRYYTVIFRSVSEQNSSGHQSPLNRPTNKPINRII